MYRRPDWRMEESMLTKLPDDVVLKILFKLKEEPDSWARLACVSPKLSTLIRTICCRSILPSVFSDNEHPPGGWSVLHKIAVCCPGLGGHPPVRPHLACGDWSLSREQGNKLLAGRFREDLLFICDWPGCIHAEEDDRYFMVFRGIFKDFTHSRVWKTINEGDRGRIAQNCAYCDCDSTWDLQSAFCLRRSFGYHDDGGEPMVRAYVCDNGHVSGAWTHLPLYT